MNILFVCTGNTCRSPMAEALLRHEYPEANVQSAGVFAANGAPASSHTIQALEEENITLDHRSQPVTDEILRWADLTLTMTFQHKRLLLMEHPEHHEKIYTLKEYVLATNHQGYGQSHDYDISDPFGGDLHLYRATRTELKKQIERLIKKIEASKGE